jgi:hypothetical protein
MQTYIIIAAVIVLVIIIERSIRNGRIEKQFTFTTFRPNRDIVSSLQVGEHVNFWVKPETDEVYIYRKGSVAGEGLIGYVPEKYCITIIKSLNTNQDFIAQITQINGYNVDITVTRNIILMDQIRDAQ